MRKPGNRNPQTRCRFSGATVWKMRATGNLTVVGGGGGGVASPERREAVRWRHLVAAVASLQQREREQVGVLRLLSPGEGAGNRQGRVRRVYFLS